MRIIIKKVTMQDTIEHTPDTVAKPPNWGHGGSQGRPPIPPKPPRPPRSIDDSMPVVADDIILEITL